MVKRPSIGDHPVPVFISRLQTLHLVSRDITEGRTERLLGARGPEYLLLSNVF